jgi:hypothetical protein
MTETPPACGRCPDRRWRSRTSQLRHLLRCDPKRIDDWTIKPLLDRNRYPKERPESEGPEKYRQMKSGMRVRDYRALLNRPDIIKVPRSSRKEWPEIFLSWCLRKKRIDLDGDGKDAR